MAIDVDFPSVNHRFPHVPAEHDTPSLPHTSQTLAILHDICTLLQPPHVSSFLFTPYPVQLAPLTSPVTLAHAATLHLDELYYSHSLDTTASLCARLHTDTLALPVLAVDGFTLGIGFKFTHGQIPTRASEASLVPACCTVVDNNHNHNNTCSKSHSAQSTTPPSSASTSRSSFVPPYHHQKHQHQHQYQQQQRYPTSAIEITGQYRFVGHHLSGDYLTVRIHKNSSLVYIEHFHLESANRRRRVIITAHLQPLRSHVMNHYLQYDPVNNDNCNDENQNQPFMTAQFLHDCSISIQHIIERTTCERCGIVILNLQCDCRAVVNRKNMDLQDERQALMRHGGRFTGLQVLHRFVKGTGVIGGDYAVEITSNVRRDIPIIHKSIDWAIRECMSDANLHVLGYSRFLSIGDGTEQQAYGNVQPSSGQQQNTDNVIGYFGDLCDLGIGDDDFLNKTDGPGLDLSQIKATSRNQSESRRKEKNRESARRSNLMKKMHRMQLEKKIDDLKSRLRTLTQRELELRTENSKLRAMVAKHL